MQRVLFYLNVFILIAIGSCSVPKKSVQKTMQSVIYKPSVNIVRPEFKVFHISDSLSQIWIKIGVNDLVFNKANPENKLLAKVRIKCYLFETPKDSIIKLSDSLIIYKDIPWQNSKKMILLPIGVPAKTGNNYLAKIEIYDQLKELGTQSFIFLNKQNKCNSQNFLVSNINTDEPVINYQVLPCDSFRIKSTLALSKLYVSYIKQKDTASFPNLSTGMPSLKLQPDSTWIIRYNKKMALSFPQKGLYHIKPDTTSDSGFYLTNFGADFPEINNLEEMIYPLTYITTPEELKAIKENDNVKIAMDNFWLRLSKNTEVSREQIRIYYNRVKYANIYFTSFKEGWKTDRGMIYVIFGPPDNVKKTPITETWIYRIPQTRNPLIIVFNKKTSDFCDNDFNLKYSDQLVSYWHQAISAWRKGEAFCF